jgi:hypothetical protein
VKRRRGRSAIGDRDLDEDAVGRYSRVLDEDVEVSVVAEHAGVEELVLEIVARELPVRGDDPVVGV